jgi:hypothetical protein
MTRRFYSGKNLRQGQHNAHDRHQGSGMSLVRSTNIVLAADWTVTPSVAGVSLAVRARHLSGR